MKLIRFLRNSYWRYVRSLFFFFTPPAAVSSGSRGLALGNLKNAAGPSIFFKTLPIRSADVLADTGIKLP